MSLKSSPRPSKEQIKRTKAIRKVKKSTFSSKLQLVCKTKKAWETKEDLSLRRSQSTQEVLPPKRKRSYPRTTREVRSDGHDILKLPEDAQLQGILKRLEELMFGRPVCLEPAS